MGQKILKTEALTTYKWLNLFRRTYINSKGKEVEWIFASRKKDPSESSIDVVVIIPTIDTPEGRKIVLVKEYRPSIDGYLYAFPAGLVEGKSIKETTEEELKQETGLEIDIYLGESGLVYASPGLTDESNIMVFVRAKGELSQKYQEDIEDIEPVALSIGEVEELLMDRANVIGAKAWGILLAFVRQGEFD